MESIIVFIFKIVSKSIPEVSNEVSLLEEVLESFLAELEKLFTMF